MRDGEVVSKDGLRLIGLYYEGRNEQNELADLWDGFLKRLGELGVDSSTPGWQAYGASQPTPKGFEYLASVEWNGDEPPEGWGVWNVPPSDYLQVDVGGVDDIHATVTWFRDEWLPQSDCRRGRGPILEIYTAGPGVTLLFPVQTPDHA